MFDKKPLTRKEWKIFKYHIQKAKNVPLYRYKNNDICIANALCRVGSHRRQPICGTYASRIREHISKDVRHKFTEEEMESIVLACMKDESSDMIQETFLPKEIVEKLSFLVPVFMSRRKTLLDLLDD